MRRIPSQPFAGLFLALALLACGGGGGGTTPPPNPAPTISSFAAGTASISVLGQTTLSWSVSNATSLRLDPGGVDLTGKTSQTVFPATTTTYTLTATNSGGSSTQQATVTIVPVAITPAGTMVHPRYQHIAVALDDGRVVVGGGYDASITYTSAEIFSPTTGTFAQGPSFTGTTHQDGAGVLLPDGRALFVGGDFRTECNLFNPTTNTFSATGNLHFAGGETACTDGAAVVLANGKVLAAGGRPGGPPSAIAIAELWDPATGVWTPTGSLNSGRAYFTLTLLKNGKVLAVGGLNTAAAGGAMASAELFDPATGTWAPTGSLQTARYGHLASILPDGKVLIAGGSVANTELFDPATGSFTAGPSTPLFFLTYYSQSVTMPNGRVLLVGGNNDKKALAVYDPGTNTFLSVAATLSSARNDGRASLMKDGRVIVTGGYSAPSPVAAVEIIR